MKALASMILLVLLTVSLTACAAPGTKKPLRVKCPACGYEFDTPSPGR